MPDGARAPGGQTPEQTGRRLEALLRAGDVNGVMDLYEDDSLFADLSGAVRGIDEIRAAHRRFLDEGNTLDLDRAVTLEAGGIALVHWAWTVTGDDGSRLRGTSAEVLRRQPDGTWKYVVDNSDGPAVLPLQ
jgi:ketosteroid isomerase-like protein